MQLSIDKEKRQTGKPAKHLSLLRRVRRALAVTGDAEPHRRLLVALSGGADSVVLTHLLAALTRKGGATVFAAHVHHGIRGDEADRDASVASVVARQEGVEFHQVWLQPKKGRLSAEHDLREARVAALIKVARKTKADRIVLAHHLDDQAETFFLRLLQGADLRGLAAMRLFRPPFWIRPLLGVPRSEILQEAESCNLPYIFDSTNAATYPRRNFLRKNVLPLLKTHFNPKIVEHLGALAESFGEISDYLDLITGEILSSASTKSGYKTKPFRDLSPALRRVAIHRAYRCVAKEGASLKRSQVYTIEKLLLSGESKKRLKLSKKMEFILEKERWRFVKSDMLF